MALTDLGNVPASSTVPIFWTSHDGATGANETMSALAVGDVLIYKGTSMTQRSSTAGITLLDTDGIDLDTLTGVNGVSIDLSDNTDAGFYAAGSFYNVVIGPVTIDAQTVYLHAATFRIVEAEATTGRVMATTAAISAGAVTAAAIATDAIDDDAIATGAIASTAFAAGAITAAAIADGAIDAATFAAGAITAAAIATDAIDADALAADALTEIFTKVLTTALTESYAADGAAPTLAQFMFMLWSALAEFSIATTTITAKKLDGSTTAMTFTLDDATNPTSRARAT